MRDQAEKLRQIIENLKIEDNSKLTEANNQKSQVTTDNTKKTTRVISITSGKGGVGKSNFTVNLGIVLAQMGYKVVIFDADLGLSNIDVLLGIAPKYNLANVINNSKDITEIMMDGPYGIKLISGGSGLIELVNLPDNQLEALISSLSKLESMADFLLIDTGAGLNNSVISFLLAASEVICITTPEPTSITDVYALIKVLSSRDRNKKINVVINKAESIGEAQEIQHKLSAVCNRFLNINLNQLGYILLDNNVVKAVKMQQPFSIANPKSIATSNISNLARKLVKEELVTENHNGIKAFISKLLGRK